MPAIIIISRWKLLIQINQTETHLKILKRFGNVIETQQTFELGSLFMKDLNNIAAKNHCFY